MISNFAVLGNSEDIGVVALPTTMIFDVDGNLRFSEAGVRKWDDPQPFTKATAYSDSRKR